MTDNNSPFTHIPGADTINHFQMENGIHVLNFENRHAETIYMIGILANGSEQDPPQKTGLAHFTANLLSRGTENIPFQDFHASLEAIGANLTFSCSTRHSWFRGKSLAEDIELLFKLAADGLRNPAFLEIYVDRLRRQLLAGLALRDQDTGEVASLLFDQYLFKDHPFGLPVDGFVETVRNISREEIIDFHRTHYSPQDMTIVLSGAVSTERIKNLAMQYFSDWKPTNKAAKLRQPIPPTPGVTIRKHRFLEGKSQVDVILGSFGPKRTSQDYLPAVVGNNILGQFGLMGRIGKSVRSSAGLAYYASSSISAWSNAGTWDISAGVNPENLNKAIELIRKEIKIFISEKVTGEELDNSKSHLIGRMPMALETNAGIANAILTMFRFKLGLDYYQKYKEMIIAISAENIQDVANKYLHPDQLVITSAGPGEENL